MALAACALAACSSGSGQSSGPVPDSNSYQDPPGNPQEALLNGEVPLANPEQPSGNSQEAPPNPQQPNRPSGTSGSGTATVSSSCNEFCVNIGQNCSGPCARLCGQVSNVAGSCVAVASRYVYCLTGISIVCGSDGRLQATTPGADCADEGRALTDCVDAATGNETNMPRPSG